MGYALHASPGNAGAAKTLCGENGADLVLEVPLGTTVRDLDGNHTLFDLTQEGGVLLLEGGRGGKGNVRFAHSRNHAPRECTQGLPGQSMLVQLELRTACEVALVGLPNVGKSALLGALTTARPRVAPYPYTTREVYVGYLHKAYGGTSIRVADLPALTEGAYAGKGLGSGLLRHAERANTLVYIVDLANVYHSELQGRYLEPWEVVEVLRREMEYYDSGLSTRAVAIWATKADLAYDNHGRDTAVVCEELRKRFSGELPVFPVTTIASEENLVGQDASLTFALRHLGPIAFSRAQAAESYRSDCEATACQERTERQERDKLWVQGQQGEIIEKLQEEDASDRGTKMQGRWLETETGNRNPKQLSKERTLAGDSSVSGSPNEDTNRISGNADTEAAEEEIVVEEAPSLVDQQLDNLYGAVSTSNITPHEAYTTMESQLPFLRDKSHQGAYWKLTRRRGERLTDEILRTPKPRGPR